MWLRSTVYDFYWPTFAHLGEQAIELREIYAQGSKLILLFLATRNVMPNIVINLRRLLVNSVAL